MNSLLQKITRQISSVLCLSVLLTSFAPVASYAQTQICTSSYAANSGCGVTRINGVDVPFHKLAWKLVPGSTLFEGAKYTASSSPVSDSIKNLANKSALFTTLDADAVANSVATFPVNVPYVFARYNPIEATLQIDVFKLEKTAVAGGYKKEMYHTTFGPAQGEMWKASRAYISPAAYKAGMVPGVNPFARFQAVGDDVFHGISLNGAQVAIGHAMRASGAPLALLAVAQPRTEVTSRTENAGWFSKRTTTTVHGYAKPAWYIAQSNSTQATSNSMSGAAFCASNPAIDSTNNGSQCQVFDTAVSGVSFEQVSGGTFLEHEDYLGVLFEKEQSGLSFVGALVLGVIGSFAIVGVAGLIGAGAGVGAGAGAGAAAGTFGTTGTFLAAQGALSATSSLATAIAVEAGSSALMMAVLGGANLDSSFNYGGEAFLGLASVRSGVSVSQNSGEITGALNARVSSATVGNSAPTAGLSAVRSTLLGGCALTAMAGNCGSVGVLPKSDEMIEQNTFKFIRDSNGSPIRN